jgi:hypothetical protein
VLYKKIKAIVTGRYRRPAALVSLLFPRARA